MILIWLVLQSRDFLAIGERLKRKVWRKRSRFVKTREIN